MSPSSPVSKKLSLVKCLGPNKAHDIFRILSVSAVIAPGIVPDVQVIMRLCDVFEICVWPFLISTNAGYTDAAPKVLGSISRWGK